MPPEARLTQTDQTRPQPTDLDQRLIALRRKAAGASKPKDRQERPTTARKMLQTLTPTDPSEDFSRRLKISATPPASLPAAKPAAKLFNPDRDSIPTIRRAPAEPDRFSDAGSSSYASRKDPPSRQLFDYRKDDPVRFGVKQQRAPPQPKSSGDYVSAASSSSYAPSQASTYTLSSTTDGSSSSGLFDKNAKQAPPTNLVTTKLKKLYREITEGENAVKQEEVDDVPDDPGRVLYKGKGKHPHPDEDDNLERDRWKKRISTRKELVEVYHSFLVISLAPSLPASLRNFPVKYNIITRLWTYGFFKLLEDLRRASFTLGSRIAQEHLQDFIIHSYTFYTNLLEEETLNEFRSGWLEALGDLARFQAAISALVVSTGKTQASSQLTTANLSSLAPPQGNQSLAPTGISQGDSPMPMVEASARHQNPSQSLSLPVASVGIAAARLLELEPDREMWRRIAKDWYGMGLADQPGTGKLHHHLGLLCREAVSDGVEESSKVELRGVYHFVKSMTTVHSFPLSRESVLPLWSPNLQHTRQRPDALAIELFTMVHGMIFTNIQLDDFDSVLSRLLEKLEVASRATTGDDRIELREWVMMAVISIAAVLEYGRGQRKAPSAQDSMDVDESASADPNSLPPSYLAALKLLFSIFSVMLRNPTRKANPFARSSLNPFLTITLTFVYTILKNPPTTSSSIHSGCLATPAGQAAFERALPWQEFSTFLSTVPRTIMNSQGLTVTSSSSDIMIKKRTEAEETWAMLTSGAAPPLPEDWCIRGMEWVGRRVFERGYWKNITGEQGKGIELEFLGEREPGWDQEDGIVEDDDDEGGHRLSESDERLKKRWVRVLRCAVGIASTVDGFRWAQGTREWRIEGVLADKIARWAEEERLAAEMVQTRASRMQSDDRMDVDDEVEVEEESDDEENEADSEEVKALKARRKYLRGLLSSSSQGSTRSPKRSSHRQRYSHAPVGISIKAGYSVLVLDTNVVLSSMSLVASLVESMQWTIIIPLPVIMELDGLTAHEGQLGIAAKQAADYIGEHVKTHGLSLKVQTSRGNYLNNLSVRRENIDFGSDSTDMDKSMDDLILRTAIAHEEQWMDRSGMLNSSASGVINPTSGEPAKVILLTLDRNLRLKARSRHMLAAGVEDIAAIFAVPKQ